MNIFKWFCYTKWIINHKSSYSTSQLKAIDQPSAYNLSSKSYPSFSPQLLAVWYPSSFLHSQKCVLGPAPLFPVGTKQPYLQNKCVSYPGGKAQLIKLKAIITNIRIKNLFYCIFIIIIIFIINILKG